MLITLAVTSLPWVTLGQVSNTSQQDTFNTRAAGGDAVVILPVWPQSSETPSPSEATGREGGGTHGPRRSGKPGDQRRPVSILRGTAETLRSCPRLPGTPASASATDPRKERHSARKVGSYLQTWEIRVLGSAGSSRGLWRGILSLRLPPPSSPHPPSCFRPRLWAIASVYIRCLRVDSTCITWCPIRRPLT